MLKISEPLTDYAVMLKLEGRLVGPWVAELKKASESILATKQMLNLDLAEVIFADRIGLALLLQLRARGVNLVNCSPFLEEELRAAPMER